MVLYLTTLTMKTILPIIAIIEAIFVITTQNPIYSVLNLIVLYIIVAFFLIYKGITYIGISYIIIVRHRRGLYRISSQPRDQNEDERGF